MRGHVLSAPEMSSALPDRELSSPLRAACRRPFSATLVFAMLGAVMVVSEAVAPGMPAIVFLVYLVAAATLLVRGARLWLRHRDPSRPRAPRLAQARLRKLPPEPPPQVNAIAYHCVICGRPLTNPQSMRARVGSTCIRQYGPRYLMVPNPQHEQWRGLRAAAEADRAAEQARLNAQHQQAMAVHTHLARSWADEVASPAGQTRKRGRSVGIRLVGVSVGSLPAVIIGMAVALALR